MSIQNACPCQLVRSASKMFVVAHLDLMIFHFNIGQFPFHTFKIPFDSQFLPVSLPFSHFSHQN